jgi:hypothetical protein
VLRCAKLRQRIHQQGASPRAPSRVEVGALWLEVKRDACNMVP